jgi:hypothetical protein
MILVRTMSHAGAEFRMALTSFSATRAVLASGACVLLLLAAFAGRSRPPRV